MDRQRAPHLIGRPRRRERGGTGQLDPECHEHAQPAEDVERAGGEIEGHVSSFFSARGAPPPLARVSRIRAQRGPQALLIPQQASSDVNPAPPRDGRFGVVDILYTS
jgi:hypothetical protein